MKKKNTKNTKKAQKGRKHKIALIAGARPNFMKIAPLQKAFESAGVAFFVVNTGQHFDNAMAGQFLKDFGIKPKYTFKPVLTSVVRQMSHVIGELEGVHTREKPDMVIVVGDVNSTLYGALAANKMGIPLAHVEAGLRSRNYYMPEELNRILVDNLSDMLFVTEESGLANLRAEGITDNVHMVGNIMIDTLHMFLPHIPETDEKFYFCTLHRAENVDDKKVFKDILDALEVISKDLPIYLPLHPRTEKMARKFGYMPRMKRIFRLLPPLSYREALFYEKNAGLILTDSGGVQEEASVFGTPCLTLRTETERPITITHGSNVIAGVKKDSILKAYKGLTFGKKKHTIPMWDGKASERIVAKIREFLSRR